MDIKQIDEMTSIIEDFIPSEAKYYVEEKDIERLSSIIDLPSKIFMTSSIGNLPVNTDGLRKAIDEIARLQTVEAELQELSAKYYNEAKDSKREIERLKKENEKLKLEVITYQKCIENLSMDNTILDSQLKEKSEWHYIMYNDLPVEDTVVWCYDGNGYFYCSYRNGDFLTQSADGKWVNVAITAWIELPKYEE